MAGKNDLNIKIQSELIKLAGTLNITETKNNINKSVTTLNKSNESLRKVQLNAKLNLTVAELNKQIATLQTMVASRTATKPIKLNVQLNMNGAVTQLTNELKGLNQQTAQFGNNFSNQAKKLQQASTKAKTDIKSVTMAQESLNRVTKTFTQTNTKNVTKAIDTRDINMLKQYVGQLYGGQVETIKVDHATNRLGQQVDKVSVQMAGAKKTVNAYSLELNRHAQTLTQTGQATSFNNSRNLGMMEQLKVAMARVPLWMVSMTAFYGSINAVRNSVSKIIEIDTLMTNINRVASDNINLDHMFDEAVRLSGELGNNLSDILTTLGDFARTYGEFNERQLVAITNTATLMSNVSELTAPEAMQNLVGTMNAFNLTAEESIRIVDSLNEVDNNYAISTKQLAEGLSRSASTAKTFGVTLEESIGHITAIGSVTMESGTLIG